jgi:hypothetical protein
LDTCILDIEHRASFNRTLTAMLCDVCNAPTVRENGILVSPERFRMLLAKGWGVHESNVKMMMQSGIPREQAIAMLTRQHASSNSAWLLCPKCAGEAEALL